MNEGYLYVATGDQYIEEALQSVRSLKKATPQAHATLITDQSITRSEFDEIRTISIEEKGGREWFQAKIFKLIGLLHTPYEKTFFVDSDTYFCDETGELFDLLDYFDLLMAQAPVNTTLVQRDGQDLEGYLPYNTGVMVFRRSDKMKQLLNTWIDVYRKKYKEYRFDQPAFTDALLKVPVTMYILQPIYNLRLPFLVALPPKKVKILHGRHVDFERTAKLLNEQLEHRVWRPDKNRVDILDKRSMKEKIYAGMPDGVIAIYDTIKRILK